MDVRTFTVGPVQENCHIARLDRAAQAIVIDPGDEPERLLGAIASLELEVAAILLTHTHFDHVGAVAPVAAASSSELPTLGSVPLSPSWNSAKSVTAAKPARMAAPRQVGWAKRRSSRTPATVRLRSSGVGLRPVRPRASTRPAAFPRCLVRRLRLVWAMGLRR